MNKIENNVQDLEKNSLLSSKKALKKSIQNLKDMTNEGMYIQENLDLQTDVLKSINNKTNTINTSVQEGRRSLNKLEKNNKVNKLCMCGIITAVIITTCVIIVLLLI